MKKTVLLFLSCIFALAIITSAQSILIEDDFESYNADELLVAQSGAPWLTWNQPYHAPHDVFVRTSQFSDGLQSIQVVTGQDIVLDFEDRETGRYQITFDIYVVSGKAAYFNILNDFDGANSTWAFQTFMNADGTATVDANGESSASHSFNHGEWININMIYDVDDDLATYYVNGVEIVSWIPSKGAMNAGNMYKLDGICLYGHTNNEYFVDEVKFIAQDLDLVPAPINLVAEFIAGDIELEWESPDGFFPESYMIFANGQLIAEGITETEYVHAAPYPNQYTYTVRAHYPELGYSHSSNEATAIVPGGIERNFVVIEKGTGTWCPYCPGAARAYKDLDDEGLNVALISYHSGDAYTTSDSEARLTYSGISNLPGAVFDGQDLIEGGHATQSLYPVYRPAFDEKITVPALYSLDFTAEQTGAETYSASISIERQTDYLSGEIRLYGVVTESAIMQNWQNQTSIDYAFRSISPSISGIVTDFTESEEFNTTIEFTLNSSWVKDNCEFIVFLQHHSSKQILQAGKVDLSTIVGIEENISSRVVVRPNPAIDFVSIYANELTNLSIISLTGQTVLTETAFGNEKHIGIGHLPAGMYIVQIEAGGSLKTERLIIQ
jgi:hypothetical protein